MKSPRLFRKWAAIGAVSGVLERKVWVRINKRTLYPNMYTLLVGPPGIGKGIIDTVDQLWRELPDLKVAPSSVSRASLADNLKKAERKVFRPMDEEQFNIFHSLQVSADEFGVFLTAYDGEFMSTLNKLFDGVPYNESKRSMKDDIAIKRPLLSILAGTTPGWLGTNLPEIAWSEGFASRLMLIYSGERVRIDPFAEEDEDVVPKLVSDLEAIHSMYGQFRFDNDTAMAFREWAGRDFAPVPDHPKLEHYAPRRDIHMAKLCMVVAASRRSDYVIRLEDYQTAQDLLLEAEEAMPDIFKSMRMATGDANVIDEAYHFVWQLFTRQGQKSVREHVIIHWLSQRLPSHSVSKVLDVMIDAKLLEQTAIGEKGRREFRPRPRES